MIYRLLAMGFAALVLLSCGGQQNAAGPDAVATTTSSEEAGQTSSGASTDTGSEASSSATSEGSNAAELMASGPRAGSISDFLDKAGTDTVLFDYDRYNIRGDQEDALRKQAAWLRIYKAATITIEGHADERGTREYNLALGERRATSVKEFLMNLGVEASRIETISYGKERPAAFGSNEEAWAQNRRGVTRVQ